MISPFDCTLKTARDQFFIFRFIESEYLKIHGIHAYIKNSIFI